MSGPYLEQTRLFSFAEMAYCSVSFAGDDRNQNPKLPCLVAISSILLSAEAEFPHILIRSLSWLEDGMVSLEALAMHLNKQLLHPAVSAYRVLLVNMLIYRGCRNGVSSPSCGGRKLSLC